MEPNGRGRRTRHLLLAVTLLDTSVAIRYRIGSDPSPGLSTAPAAPAVSSPSSTAPTSPSSSLSCSPWERTTGPHMPWRRSS